MMQDSACGCLHPLSYGSQRRLKEDYSRSYRQNRWHLVAGAQNHQDLQCTLHIDAFMHILQFLFLFLSFSCFFEYITFQKKHFYILYWYFPLRIVLSECERNFFKYSLRFFLGIKIEKWILKFFLSSRPWAESVLATTRVLNS